VSELGLDPIDRAGIDLELRREIEQHLPHLARQRLREVRFGVGEQPLLARLPVAGRHLRAQLLELGADLRRARPVTRRLRDACGDQVGEPG
jgi:hypothetical protein